ncbi:MAG: ABC transporter substrate-binding protein [Chloroflexota bacterium]|nr:ABC transporter substrate-binding protein [Chloroflexota bacterium]
MRRGRPVGRGLTRREFLFAGAGAGLLVLGGCGAARDQAAVARAAASGGARYTGPPVELGFWNGFTGGDGQVMSQLVSQFNKEHKNIKVDMVTMIWVDFYQKFPGAVAAGEGPDVAVMHIDQLALNAARGVIVPLGDVVRALGLQKSDFAPVIWEGGTYKGKRYGIPLDTHPLGLYCNKAVMEKGGLDPDRPPQTKDEYMGALEQLKGKGIKGSWVPTGLYTAWMMFQSLLWQFGGELYDKDVTRATVNSDAGVDALSWMVDLIKNGYSPSNVAQDADVIALQNGQNAFNWNGIWMINTYGAVPDLQWGVAPLPQIGTQKAAWANSHNFVIANQPNPNRDKLQAAKVFINWISTHSLEWAKGGQVPARNSVRESSGFERLQWQPEFAKELPYVHFGPSAPGVSEIGQNILFTAVNSAVLGIKSPKSALDTAAERANQLLQQNRQKYGG